MACGVPPLICSPDPDQNDDRLSPWSGAYCFYFLTFDHPFPLLLFWSFPFGTSPFVTFCDCCEVQLHGPPLYGLPPFLDSFRHWEVSEECFPAVAFGKVSHGLRFH